MVVYQPDVGWHGTWSGEPTAAQLSGEPSLTLCTPAHFGRWAGPVARSAFLELARTSAFARIAARGSRDSGVSVRFTTRALWLDRGESPASRREWRLSRVGASRPSGSDQLVDISDPLGFPSFLAVSCFVPDAAPGATNGHLVNGKPAAATPIPIGLRDSAAEEVDRASHELMMSGAAAELPAGWVLASQLRRDIDAAVRHATPSRTVPAGNRQIVSFSPRTLHRTGRAPRSGWWFSLQIGLHTARERCAADADQLATALPVSRDGAAAGVLRPVGVKQATAKPERTGLRLDQDEAAVAAFAAEHELRAGESGDPGESGDTGDVEHAVAEAALGGLRQLGLALPGMRIS